MGNYDLTLQRKVAILFLRHCSKLTYNCPLEKYYMFTNNQTKEFTGPNIKEKMIGFF